MNEDELKKLWQQQPLRDPAISPAQVLPAMQNIMTQLRRTLLGRDIVEVVACVLAMITFGYFFFRDARWPISRLGDLIVIGGSILIAFRLVYARWTTRSTPVGATIVESLRAELKAVRAQSQLLSSVGWWYLLPLGTGIFVRTWGSFTGGLGRFIFNVTYTIGVIALYGFIYRLNQRACANQLLPVERQLESLLHAAETGEPLDETDVSQLRPVILSMAAAGHIKPAEFKVAFWQIAIFGMPGIVGIWFFWMLGLTMGDKDWKTNEPPPTTVARSVRVEETNRYAIVAQKVVDLFNAGDYAALQKLYNPDMSKAFPPEKTSDFYTRLATNRGKIENFDGPTTNGYAGWTAFLLHYQNSEMTMSLALDADDKISGIYFQPAPRAPVHFKLFVRRLVSWQHLVWLPPFFLGGLLYSWLIQQVTRRAVGISILGIHLSKGQSLILWPEIKELRPFRFLHIRNLWVIRESGEKTLMHWTPLERHSDLKAAVESSAPANHPIRKHLSLLKGI
ncbi:MAG: hypothetical protein JWM16_2631 [Verrucomicrobiales bacterium]|nr:hypothetical protein [Verrucomicrobiales bacterium]